MAKKKFIVVAADRKGGHLAGTEEAEELAKVNAELVIANCGNESEIIEAAKNADVVITGGAPMTRRVMEALPACLAIVRYGVGYDTIDVPAATDCGIIVVNIPDFCWEEVSNHAMTLLLACAKKLAFLNDGTKRGRWRECKQAQAPMVSIWGQTLGIIGCGNIGRATAKKAHCFSLNVLGYDPYLERSIAREAGIKLVSLRELLRQSDFISLHTPLDKSTFHLIGEAELKQMKPGAYLINTARGPVVDEAALIKALQEKWIAGAGLDVFEKEPVDPDNPLLKMDNVVVTPHSASYSDAAFSRLRRSAGSEAARVLSGKWPRNWVNKDVKPKVNLTQGD